MGLLAGGRLRVLCCSRPGERQRCQHHRCCRQHSRRHKDRHHRHRWVKQVPESACCRLQMLMLPPVCMHERHHRDLLSLLPQTSQPGQQRCRCSSTAAGAGYWTARPPTSPASPQALKEAWWLAHLTHLLWHPLRCVQQSDCSNNASTL